MKIQQSRNQDGFTLIEVMVALAVLVIGVVGVMMLQTLTIKGNSNSIAITRLVQESNAALDMVESLPYTSNELVEGTGSNMSTLFGGIAPPLSATITYDVSNRTDVEIQNLYGLSEKFDGAQAKVVVVNANKLAGGSSKNVQFQYVKIDM